MKNTNNIIALIFLYSLDRLEQLDHLCSKVNGFDIYLTASDQHKNNEKLSIFCEKHKDRIIRLDFHANYGVDIAPFIKQLISIDSDKYPYFIKLHAKSSTLGIHHHVDWGSILWDSLIGNQKLFDQNTKILQQKHVGSITQPLLIFKNKEFNNIQKIKILCNIFDIDYNDVKNSYFMAGTMFMSKTYIFQDLIKKNIKYLDAVLSTESGKVNDRNHENGAFCHAMERLFGYIIISKNLIIHKSSLYPIINIYNSKEKILHLHTTYNNIAYLVEDFNICGRIEKNDNYFTITWNHLENLKASYQYLDSRTATRKI